MDASFFSLLPSSAPLLLPKDPDIHRPLSVLQFLNKKLRWLTLGGQYDWTAKVYPPGEPPKFPKDVADLLRGLFPEMVPEAAIVNVYSPGDMLSMHRDVAEQCGQGLVSLSLGCDAIFVIGLESESEEQDSGTKSEPDVRVAAFRLRSGDALYMSAASRYAWHGVPQVIPDTCPEWLKTWPADDGGGGEFAAWSGWMAGKRINLNVRQMFE